MVIDLVGVVEDGLPRGAQVPASPRKTLTVPRGTDLKIRLSVVSASGAPVVLSGGTVSMAVKKRPQDGTLISRLGILVPAEGPNRADLFYIPSDWRAIEPIGYGGRFLYDVWLSKDGKQNSVVPTSPLVLPPSVTDAVGGTLPPFPTPSGGGNTGTYSTVDGSGAPREVVYLTSADFVAPADNDDPAKQPVIGLIQTKPTTTQAIVQYSGEMGGFTGLTPGATYFLGPTPGTITDVAPTMTGAVLQRVGFAKNTTTLVIMIDRDFVVL